MKFVDSVKIHVRSGTGGSGCSSFRREKYVPRGGPDGGDGGSGGNIIFYGDPQKNTLLDLSFNQHQHAFNGLTGAGKNQQGKNGQDRRIPVPLGTVVKDSESGEVLLEILEAKSYLFLKGGKGVEPVMPDSRAQQIRRLNIIIPEKKGKSVGYDWN